MESNMSFFNEEGKDQIVVQQLHEMFGNKLQLSLIEKVAKSCQFDVNQSSNELLEITNLSHVAPNGSTNIVRVVTQPSPNKSKKATELEKIIKEINDGYKVVVILRGLSGSGKSTLAKKILSLTIGCNDTTVAHHILSADDFFIRNGVYMHDPRQISEAHGWNHNRAFRIMSQGFSPVIIDNTHSQMWEMKPYAAMATDYGYILEILEPDTHWCFNDKELSKRNVHGVGKSTIRHMMDRYEKNVTPIKLLTAYGYKYNLQKPPQFRLHPPLQQVVTTNRMFSEPFNGQAKPNTENYLENKHSSPKYARLDKQNGQAPKNGVEVFGMFSGSEASISTRPTGNEVDFHAAQSSSVDDILMSNDTSALQAPVLKPVQTCKLKQSTSLFDNINAWGVDANALRSWDIVTPLEDNTDTRLNQPIVVDDDIIVETNESSTMTDETYFSLLKHSSVMQPSFNINILTTCSRDINRNVPPKPPGIMKKYMIDKSCNTEDIFAPSIDIDHLANVFPNIGKKNIQYWYEKCNRDFECTMELLLSEKDEIINIVIEDLPKEPANISEVIAVDSDSSSCNEEPDIVVPSSKHKRKPHNSSSDDSQDLKKQLESKFTISDDHYSEKLLKVKSRQSNPQPSSSGFTLQASESAKSVVSMDVDELNEDDIDFLDDLDSCSSPKDEQVEDIETVELNFGDQFVTQLEENFGDPNLIYPKGFQPVVQLPKALARQLYAFYIESVYQQVEAQNAVMADLIKEDEEFARKLQQDEENGTETLQSNLGPFTIPEIIKEQKELSKAQREADKWKEETPDTLAARLTREKLFSSFPSIERNTLVEILHAHENLYKDTVETLLESTGAQNVKGDLELIKHPPIHKQVLDEMWEAHQSCRPKQETESTARSASIYRAEANGYLEKRTQLYEKAKTYYQSGMMEVAQFYSSLAIKQTKLYEFANSLAATAFLDEHSKRLEDFNTLDLHFLFVKEAIPHLDIYLDRNINLLKGTSQKNSETLQIITGRGKNSKNGVSRLRPAVLGRLKERHIGYQQLNPGLIKVKITRNSKLTNELWCLVSHGPKDVIEDNISEMASFSLDHDL